MPSKSKKHEPKPYTYLLGWPKYDRWYYGVQYGNRADPSNLMETYFSSSKLVKRFIDTVGLPTVVQIRKIFLNAQHAREYEHKVLRRLRVTTSHKWLNLTENKSPGSFNSKLGRIASQKLYGNRIGFRRAEFDGKRSEWASNAAHTLHTKCPGNITTEHKRQNGKMRGGTNVSEKIGIYSDSFMTTKRHEVSSKVGIQLVVNKKGIHDPKYANRRSEWAKNNGNKLGDLIRGMVWIHHDDLSKNIRVSKAEVATFLLNGWKGGMIRRAI